MAHMMVSCLVQSIRNTFSRATLHVQRWPSNDLWLRILSLNCAASRVLTSRARPEAPTDLKLALRRLLSSCGLRLLLRRVTHGQRLEGRLLILMIRRATDAWLTRNDRIGCAIEITTDNPSLVVLAYRLLILLLYIG